MTGTFLDIFKTSGNYKIFYDNSKSGSRVVILERTFCEIPVKFSFTIYPSIAPAQMENIPR